MRCAQSITVPKFPAFLAALPRPHLFARLEPAQPLMGVTPAPGEYDVVCYYDAKCKHRATRFPWCWEHAKPGDAQIKCDLTRYDATWLPMLHARPATLWQRALRRFLSIFH